MAQLSDPLSTKIGYVVKRYPRFSETFVVNEILAHEAAGTGIEIFALRPVQETHFQDAISRVRAPVTHVPDRHRTADVLWTQLARAEAVFPGAAARAMCAGGSAADVTQALVIATACRERGIGHLHAHFGTLATTVARLAAAIAGIGYSFTAHAKDIYHDYGHDTGLAEKLRDADAVATVSEFNLAHLRNTYGADAEKVTRIYNGLDLGGLDWRAPDPDATEILAVGRLVEKKGFHILIEALLILGERGPRPRCRIIGQGEEEENLRAQIAGAGLAETVTLDGPLPQPDVFAAMRRAAVLACPCVVGRDGNRDGLPTVLIEALALGTPCVGSDVTGIPEIVRHDETGLIARAGDSIALADALQRLLADADARSRLSRAGRALVERDYDIHRNAAALRGVFADCLARRSEARMRGAA
ncbi:glycosyltransferase family 4 protein [Marivita sp.]|uniref:glycosyltransferase family 4 protein n=1 Tax=Marivita sp. TaxID=2003365 RepID=UPI0025C3B08F|nr:glycosyltransferase family 4 protein [Marivita sp.]